MNAMIMTIDIDDTGPVDTIFVGNKNTLNTYIHRVIALDPTNVTGTFGSPRKDTEWMFVGLDMINNKRWWVFGTTKARCEIANETMVKHAFWYFST